MNENNIKEFKKLIEKSSYEIQENILLKEYTSLKIGGYASLFSAPNSIDEFEYLIEAAKKADIPYFIIGNGSNILISDQGFNGLIILTKNNFNKILLIDENTIVAQAGASLMDVCKFALANSLTGLEFAYGIPASVGGAVYMNAGAYGGEIKDVLLDCKYLDEDNNIKVLRNEEIGFSYRNSFFSDTNNIILEARFKLQRGSYNNIEKRMNELLERRQLKQPLEYPSAGSTFKRPVGNYASALIDKAGLKGFVHKRAMVSDKHAGFVVNHDNATSDEFLELIEIVKDVVKKKTGYELECEIKIIRDI